jgi:hypothetical protein
LFVTLSVGMHGLLLWSSPRTAGAAFGSSSTGSVIQARLVALPARAAARAGESFALNDAKATNVARAEAAQANEPAAPKAEDARPNPVDPAAPPVAGEVAGEERMESPPARDASADYLPSTSLTRGPEPTKSVILAFPKPWNAVGRYRAKFALYVDESGVVQRVERVDMPDFPTSLEGVVRRTFMGVLFKPGELDGRAVRARMLIEVSFDAEARPVQP